MDAGRDIRIMAILNLTPDSYYAPSRHDLSQADSGADILDVGAVSTRPGASEVSEEEEWGRLEPFLRTLPDDVNLSIDTFRSGIVERTADLIGRPFMVNDISAGEDDPRMLGTVARLGLGYVAMHKRGTPATMSSMCGYQGGVTAAVVAYFKDFSMRAEDAGISDWVLDPGFGFAKTVEQNYMILRDLGEFLQFGRRILVGISRKSMVYKPLGITPEEALPATQALHMEALMRGADILRVHDVQAARHTVDLYRLLEG